MTDDNCEMVDMNAATVVLKQGNGDTPENQELYDVQSNMRERFALQNQNDDDENYE